MGIINDALTGYKLGQAGKVVHGLLITDGQMGGPGARLDTDVLIRSADRAIGAALLTGQHKGYPHKLAVAAYALAGGLTLGKDTPTFQGIYTASYAALTALFARLGDPQHLSPYHPLNQTLINSAFATLQDAKEQAGH